MIIIPLMTMLALGTAALVWFGVTHGLRILTPLRTRLAQRRGDWRRSPTPTCRRRSSR